MRRILHIGDEMAIGGAQRALYQLIKAQKEHGKHVALMTSDKQGFYSNEVLALGAEVIEVGRSHSIDFVAMAKYLQLARRYDLVHFHSPNPALMFASFCLSKKIKLFYTHRGGRHNYQFRRRLAYSFSGFCIRNTFSAISGNTAHAAVAAAELLNTPKNRVYTTYNGIDFGLLSPRRSREDILFELSDTHTKRRVRIGTSANFRKWKRTDYLLNAIAELGDANIVCYAFGDGPELNSLQNHAKRLGISQKVQFPGKKSHIGDYLQILDVFVLPSDELESFGNSAVEAMGLGIPTIVMRDGGGLVEHITAGGGLIAENEQHLAKLLENLVKLPELRSQIGVKGKSYVREKYTYKNMIDGYERLYQTAKL